MRNHAGPQVGATQLAIKVATDADLGAHDTKYRVIEGIVERLSNLASSSSGSMFAVNASEMTLSRIELMLDIHDWIVKAIAENKGGDERNLH